MPGTTGKRARDPKPCFTCGKPITDYQFLRDRRGDEHIDCYMKREHIELTPAKEPTGRTASAGKKEGNVNT